LFEQHRLATRTGSHESSRVRADKPV